MSHRNCTDRYNYGGFVHLLDGTCDAWIRDCNIWASNLAISGSSKSPEFGLRSAGSSLMARNNKLTGFNGAAIAGGGGVVDVQGCQLKGNTVAVVDAGEGSQILPSSS